MKNKVLLFDNDSLTKLYNSTLLKLNNKGSVNVVTYPGSSKKTKLKILFECDSKIENHKNLFFHFDCEAFNLDSNQSFLDSIQFMLSKANTEWKDNRLNSLSSFSSLNTNQFVQTITSLSEFGYRIIFFIENHEQLIVENNLKLLPVINLLFQNPQLHISLLWLTAKDLFNYDIELKEDITRFLNTEIVWEKDFPFTKLDLDNSLKFYEKELDLNSSNDVKKSISELTYKDASLIKYLMFRIKNNSIDQSLLNANDLSNQYLSIDSNYLDKKYNKYIKMLSFEEVINLKNKKYSECIFLNQLGLIENNEIIQPLFKYFIEYRLSTIINSVENRLTGTEKLVFQRLKSNTNKVVTRDEIADVLWGDRWITKYSDYMIDKVISNIRKKLEDKYTLEVVKGTGFIINNINN